MTEFDYAFRAVTPYLGFDMVFGLTGDEVTHVDYMWGGYASHTEPLPTTIGTSLRLGTIFNSEMIAANVWWGISFGERNRPAYKYDGPAPMVIGAQVLFNY